MRSNLKLADDMPPRSPERVELAEAIERHEAAQTHIDRLQAAIERMTDDVHAAVNAVEDAEVTLKRLKAEESHYLARMALGELSENPIVQAERAFDDARTKREAASKTRDALTAEVKTAQTELGWAARHLDRAVGAVLRSEGDVDGLIEESAALQRQLSGKLAILRLLHGTFDNPRQVDEARRLDDFLGTPLAVDPRHPAAAPWRKHARRCAPTPTRRCRRHECGARGQGREGVSCARKLRVRFVPRGRA
jgi:hypothetical protein